MKTISIITAAAAIACAVYAAKIDGVCFALRVAAWELSTAAAVFAGVVFFGAR